MSLFTFAYTTLEVRDRKESRGSYIIGALDGTDVEKKEFCQSPGASDCFLSQCNPRFPSVLD